MGDEWHSGANGRSAEVIMPYEVQRTHEKHPTPAPINIAPFSVDFSHNSNYLLSSGK
jgi:hypothetical protein